MWVWVRERVCVHAYSRWLHRRSVEPSLRWIHTYSVCTLFRYSHTLHLHWLPQWNIIYVVKRNRLEHTKHTSSSSSLPPPSSNNKQPARKQTINEKPQTFSPWLLFSLWIWFRNIHWLLTRSLLFASVQSVTSRLFNCTVRCSLVCVSVRVRFHCGFSVLFHLFSLFTYNISNRQLKHLTWRLLCFVHSFKIDTVLNVYFMNKYKTPEKKRNARPRGGMNIKTKCLYSYYYFSLCLMRVWI